MTIPQSVDQAGGPQGGQSAASEGGSPQKKGRAEKNGPGVFARILSGLQGKPGARPVRENSDADPARAAADPSDIKGAHFSNVKTHLAGLRSHEKPGADLDAKTSAELADDALLSELDKNILGNLFARAAGEAPGAADGEKAGGRTIAAGRSAVGGSEAGAKVSGDAVPDAAEGLDALAATTGRREGAARSAASKPVSGDPAQEEASEVSRRLASLPGEPADGAAAEKPRDSARNARNAELRAAAREVADGDFRNGAAGQASKDDAGAAGGRAAGHAEARAKEHKRVASSDLRDFRISAASTETAQGGSSEIRGAAEGQGRDLVVELRAPNQGGGSSATTTWETRPAGALENALARELNQNVNGDIVRQASIVLREGNEGVIRLALKPDTLGNVKIHLEMAENKITGYIVVESEEAMRAFERELDSLEREFREAGFEGADLSMSLAADGGERRWRDAENEGLLPGGLAASRYDASAETEETAAVAFYRQGTGAVDVLA